MQDEQTFTAHAELGWLSWDEWSPEQDFCRFAGMLQRMLQPAWVLETGVGVGRLTSHLDLDGCEYVGFESDPQWRQPPAHPDATTPTAEQMATAQLVILDSDPSYRLQEIRLWADVGARGSVCLVHDAGNGHDEDTIHYRIGAVCAATGQLGVLLRNPRGGWLGVHT
ncbi:hypothetical protein [Streptomyces asiaticus]|uniref:hypothetical protein n=1 Tax=Streptomyces asiaticus TaxID=114695 RepID=UPI001BAB8C23|nr:hypothetical protein [Streptomyces asiaticus]